MSAPTLPHIEEITLETTSQIAIDIGGTFTDVALQHDEKLHTTKTPTTQNDPVQGVLNGIELVIEQSGCKPSDIERIIHGTTLATNALIERKGSKTGLITTQGFKDIIEIAYERRYDQYAINLVKPDLLVTRSECWTLPERVNALGEVIQDLDVSGLDGIIAEMKGAGIETVAVCFLHSYANPSHEKKLGTLLSERWPELSITLSSDVCPEVREFDRACTALANAFIKPLMSSYLSKLAAALKSNGYNCPLLIVTSGGGMATLETAAENPIRLVESGPSGGAVLAAKISARCGIKEALSFDMGGTTAKLCVVDNFTPQRSRFFEIGRAERFMKGSGLPVRIPVVEMIEIGAGGGSIAHIDTMGQLAIGPESAGSDPGPACYNKGGERPTVTDSDVALGFIDPDEFAEKRLPLKPKLARSAIQMDVGNKTAATTNEAAYGISQMVDENMANAGRVHLVEHGKKSRGRTMIAFGGNGPLHATRVAEKLNIDEIIIPRDPGVGSAIGFLAAPISYEIVRSLYVRSDKFDLPAVRDLLEKMQEEAVGVVRTGSPKGKIGVHKVVFMRYKGQGHEIEVPLPDGSICEGLAEALCSRFESAYEKRFNRTVPFAKIEMVNWAVVVSTATATPETLSRPTIQSKPVPERARKVYWGPARQEMDFSVYQREALVPGNHMPGPALIIEAQTTTLVSPSYDATIDGDGNIFLNTKTSDAVVKQ